MTEEHFRTHSLATPPPPHFTATAAYNSAEYGANAAAEEEWGQRRPGGAPRNRGSAAAEDLPNVGSNSRGAIAAHSSPITTSHPGRLGENTPTSSDYKEEYRESPMASEGYDDKAASTMTTTAVAPPRPKDKAVKNGQKKVRKRTTRACDQCNQLRTKCDGMQPCAHCIELKLACEYLRVPLKRGKASQSYIESANRKAQAKENLLKTQPKKNQGPPAQPGQTQNLGISVLMDDHSGARHQQQPPSSSSSSHQHPQSQQRPGLPSLNHYSSYPSVAGLTDSTEPPAFLEDARHNHSHSPAGDLNFDIHHNDSSNNHGAEDTSKQNNPPTSAEQQTQQPQGGTTASGPSNNHHTNQLMFSPLLEGSPNHLFPQTPSWFTSALDSTVPGDNNNNPATTAGPGGGSGTTTASGNGPGYYRSTSIGAGPASQSPSSTSFYNHVPLNSGLASNDLFNSLHSPQAGQQPQPVGGGRTSTTPKFRPMQYDASRNAHHPQPYYKPTAPAASTTAVVHHGHQASQGPTSGIPSGLRYPVLLPILDSLASINVSVSLADDLLETYFAHCTHVLAYLVRRVSVLSYTHPRKTSPSLLYAMLLVAAHDSDNPAVTGTPSARQVLITKLTEMTVSNLESSRNIMAPGSLDEVISYIQLGTVMSASEFKGSSLRWWGNAWAMAKELKLNQESTEIDPETREEQRRTWWLLYMVDRHLGLCYNRPLAILDSESMGLYQPESEDIWNSESLLTPPEVDPNRRERGVCHMVTGQGIYGYFLPLMSILGMLVEVHLAEQNPLLPMRDSVCQQLRSTIRSSLDQYASSLKNWNPVPCQESYGNAWKDYALQLVHVFHILYSVSWDPIELLTTSESLMNHPDFGKVTNHAIMAAKSIRRILTIDPDLMLMPFFFGVYLLQGSFVLLAIVDRVESEASSEVFAACETIVHAHEVCIVTLNTEYQRNFRKVMRGTMSLLSSGANDKHTPSSAASQSPTNGGGSLHDKEEARKRRQDVLGLYRWSAGGHGLAV
ncbi:hypothetical protein TRVA0_015S00518 [Trichomonascus vanleenenianus]|uniref:uncharacterized protein n=1 Tax=Trichomonascus vanleenenianus TaxID=2268995 RepID=UPI003ECBACAB